MRRAMMAYGRGDLSTALRHFDDALRAAAGDAEALFMRGTVHFQLGRVDEALQDLRAAAEARPRFPKAWNNLGVILRKAGRFAEAKQAFNRATEQDPDYAEAHYNCANAHVDSGDLVAAEDAYRRALALRADYQDAQLELAATMLELGQVKTATTSLEDLAARHPEDARVWVTLGNARRATSQPVKAQQAYQEALRIQPDWTTAINNLGAALADEGQTVQAANFYRRAVALEPSYGAAWANLAKTLRALGHWVEAEAAARRATALMSEDTNAWLVLGNVLLDRARSSEAATAFQRAVELSPSDFAPHANLAAALSGGGDAEGALAACRRALERRPDQPVPSALLVKSLMQCAQWEELCEAEQRLDAIVDAALNQGRDDLGESPFLSVIRRCDPARNLAVAQARSRTIAQSAASSDIERRVRQTGPAGPLRVGYLSGDLHSHATAHLMSGLFERHDRARVEVIAYSYGPDDGGPHRQRIAKGCDQFVDISELGPRQAAQRIHDDGIQVLVDLKGHTQNTRLAICALRPAPVQACWLGFPGSTGAKFMDYALVDSVVAPAEDDRFWSEALVRLPGSYQVNDVDQAIGPQTNRRAHRLPTEGFVFCSFNQPYKMRPSTWDTWMRLLQQTPGSVLWLLSGAPTAHQNLRSEASRRGVDPERLVFAPQIDKPLHLSRLALADLALDPFEIGGHTTTSDALWARVPVLTLRGDHFASRVAASLLQAVGLPELVTDRAVDYEALALDLARSENQLEALRGRLESRERTELFDTDHFARKLERAYEFMWSTHLSGNDPAPFSFK